MHFAAHCDLLLADYWNIVFCLTRNGARVTANADIQIHHHSPFVALVGIFLRVIQRLFARWMFLLFLREMRIGDELVEGAVVKNPARTVYVVLLLGAREPMARPGFANR